MNKLEVSQLLTAISTYDNRKIATETVEAWYLVLRGFDYEEASEAVVLHFSRSTDWLLPAHIITNIRIIQDRKDRIARITRPRIEAKVEDYEFDREAHEKLVRQYAKGEITNNDI